MPADHRRLLHRTIGLSLLGPTGDVNSTMHLLAVDQINFSCNDGQNHDLSHDDLTECAKANSIAAKYAMAASSFEKGELLR